MKNKIFIYLFLLLIGNPLFSQTADNGNQYLYNGKYLNVSGGISTGLMRDMVTSPLFYTAAMPAIAIEYAAIGEKNTVNFNFTTLNGFYLASGVDDSYISNGHIFDFELAYYRNIQEYGHLNFPYYLGVSVGNYSALRINEALMNAGVAFDNFTDFDLNIKADWQFTRHEKKKKLFWLIPYTKKEKHFLISGKLGVPVYSLIYRPGYTNPGNSTLNNEILFPGYEMSGKVFSGMNTDLSISRFLNNGNMIKFSYFWEYMTTGRMDVNRLDTSRHMFLFTLVFKIK